MLFQRLWVWAIVAMPTEACRHLCLDKLGGRRILLTAPFPRTPLHLLYHPHHAYWGTNSDRLTDSVTVTHTVTTLIKHLPWRGKDVTAAGRISPGCLCQTIVCFKFIISNTSLILEIIMMASFMGQWECWKWKLNPRSCLFCGWMERKRESTLNISSYGSSGGHPLFLRQIRHVSDYNIKSISIRGIFPKRSSFHCRLTFVEDSPQRLQSEERGRRGQEGEAVHRCACPPWLIELPKWAEETRPGLLVVWSLQIILTALGLWGGTFWGRERAGGGCLLMP